MSLQLKSVFVITPGSYPVPAALTGSVELSVMQTFLYLASSFDITVIGRQQDGVLPALEQTGLMEGLPAAGDRIKFVQVCSNIEDYLSRAIAHLPRHIKAIVHIENRPAFVKKIRKLRPLSRIWLNLHSKTFLSPDKIDGRTLKEALYLADRIVVNSHYIKQYVINAVPAARSKVWVNYPGVNHLYYSPDEESRYSPGPSSREPVILYSGRLIRKKGVADLLLAMAKVIAACPAAKLYVIGSADYIKHRETAYTRSLKKLAAGLGSSVVFIPHIPAAELVKWYRRSDIFVCPSIKDEAFGLVNLEAMACAVPVVASKVGGIPEAVKHRYSGLLVSLENHAEGLARAIIYLLSHPEKARLMGLNGRKRVSAMFTWRHTAARLKRDYEANY